MSKLNSSMQSISSKCHAQLSQVSSFNTFLYYISPRHNGLQQRLWATSTRAMKTLGLRQVPYHKLDRNANPQWQCSYQTYEQEHEIFLSSSQIYSCWHNCLFVRLTHANLNRIHNNITRFTKYVSKTTQKELLTWRIGRHQRDTAFEFWRDYAASNNFGQDAHVESPNGLRHYTNINDPIYKTLIAFGLFTVWHFWRICNM